MRVSHTQARSGRSNRLLKILLGTTISIGAATAQQAAAQTRVVSACSGVQLPRSVVTYIVAPVVTGITAPIEQTVNGILNLPLLGAVLPPLNTNATGLLNQAASGAPITLQVLDTNGNIVGPNDQCQMTADAISLDSSAGLSIGGNRISGLGLDGTPSFAADVNAIAFGNNARAEAGATGSIAFGTNAQVTAANSVALGAGSIAGRGAQTGYTAIGLTGTQNSAGEVSVGTAGGLRQITNVAAGSAATDAATVGQVTGVADRVTALAANTIGYDDATRARATLAGAGGTVLANVGAGALNATSTEAVNGAQLFATNGRVDANTAAIGGLDTRVTANTQTIVALQGSTANAVRYDVDAAGVRTGGVTLVGTTPGAAVRLGNVDAGALSATSTDAVNGSQLFATDQRLGAAVASLAALDTQVTANTSQLAALGASAVQYDNVARDRLTLGGSAGTVLANVAAGSVSANSTEAVNGAQLFAVNAQVAANTNAIAQMGNGSLGPVRYSTAATPTTPNGGTVTDDLTLVGASGGAVALHNVAGGTVGAGSTDAVNGDQLNTTNQAVGVLAGRTTTLETVVAGQTTQIAGNTAAIADLQANVTGTGSAVTNLTTRVDANSTAITNLQTQVGNQPLKYADAASPTTPNGGTLTDDATLVSASGGAVGLHNLRAGNVAIGSTDAVNGGQLAETNLQVAANTSAISTLANSLAGSTVSPIQYSNPDSPTASNGGTLTNDVTLVGANPAAAVTLHNVAAGSVAAGSTDAVNGGQLFAVAQQSSNSLQYDRDATGARTNQITLAGGNAAAPVTIANVAAGTVAAGSTQAVNGGQLYAVNQTAQAALTLGANSVQYDGSGNVTLGNAAGTPVALRNVAAGTAATDAVNLGQLQAGLQSVASQTANYIDSRIADIGFDLGTLRRDLSAGSSAAMAVAALPQAMEPGATMIAMGGGTYRGQSAIAFGASRAFADGRAVVKVGGTYDSRGFGGANAGVGFQF
ncbi:MULTISPECIES: YadA family autotransporter adhesin [Sphingomonas]|jgi:autotransporter adhesin|uniref:YadA family autotransporter adhesin n=1 Tax=Sphingomonas TaxID=13687 RepID=UPI000AEA6351|nr:MULTISPECIES: YadA-like family protein [Sphingomonas]WCP70920.1 YadA-like family protein [Sphingomonas hankookensis]